jgi:hypothetical protein
MSMGNLVETKIKEVGAYWRFSMHFSQAREEICNRCKEIRWVGARFSRVPAYYPDSGITGHYKNVFKTPTMLNDNNNTTVHDFTPRANLTRFF